MELQSTGVVTTFVGTNTAGYSDGGGWFNSPFGVAMDWNGTVYVADTNNNRIRKITSLGVVSTLAGNGLLGQANGTGTNATFFLPRGVALGLDETVYVADTNNNRIRRITAAGVVTTMAGQTTAGSFDGTGTNATFNSPNALTVDFTNTVYVADTGSHCIRRITSGGVVTKFAGTTQGFQDGVGTNASFNTPRGIVVDMYGNFYVADTNNHNIRRITSDGTVTTLAGSTAGYADGTGTNARFNFPTHLSIDALGTLYVADQTNNRIRTVQTSTGVVSTLAGDGTAGFTPSRFNTPQGITLDRFRNAYVADSGNHSIPKIGNAFTLPENNGVVTTFAGSTQGFLDGTGIGARFNFPTGVTVDSAGTFYIADRGQQRIRRITSAGVVTLLAGQTNTGATDGTGAAASFNNPYGITVDSVGNVYVADTSNNRIRRITPAGLVSTLAGSTIGSFNGIGTNATFNGPTGVVVNSEGIMYVADQSNHLIRRIAISGGGVTTLAGTVLTGGSADGTGTNATFSRPSGVAVDSSGTVYVADTDNHRIRKITPAGVVTTLAGSTLGSTNGTGTNAQFNAPTGVAVDSAGNVYVADQTNNRIRKITSEGVVTTLAGSTAAFANGTGTNAQFNTPYGVAVDSAGNVYVADQSNHLIRKIGSGVIQVPLNRAVVTTFAGNGTPSAINGTGTSATFQFPTGLAVDSVGNIYVGEQNNNRIRRITTTGVVSTLAGSGNATFADGTGAGASFNLPYGVAVDSSGTVYVADTDNHRIRKITPAGVVTTLAGQSTTGNTDGTGTNARFFYPYGVAVDSTGNVYVGDRSNNRIRRITPAGVVTTFAGSTAGSFDGTGTNATFRSPLGIAVDSSGNVYVADSLNYRIRKITPVGVVTTLAGSTEGFVNGTGTNAMFKSPAGVAVDSVGNIYVGDQSNNVVRRITPAGVVTTLAGSGTAAFADGTGVSASFNNPYGVTVDLGGILYVADQNNHRIRKIQ
jgi:streptogramin lyase